MKTPRGRLMLMIVLCALFLVGWRTLESDSSAQEAVRPREIILKIQNMSFGNNNPAIYLEPGETVRFIIHNLDVGMKHDFVIQGTDVASRILDYGEKDAVLFTAPRDDKEMKYQCSLHALMMQGRLVVSHDYAFQR